MLPRALFLLCMGFVAAFGMPNDDRRYRSTTNSSEKAIFCHVNGSKLVSQSQNYQTFNIDHINVDLCTHVVLEAAFLDPNSWDIRPINNELENYVNELKSRNQKLQVYVSVTGSNSNFSTLAKNYRQQFVSRARAFVLKFRFDGLNIDWQYPSRKFDAGENLDAKENFAALMKDLKVSLRIDGKSLAATISPLRPVVREGYDTMDSVLMESVDYWFIRAVDYHGHWSSVIGPNSPVSNREQISVGKTIKDLKAEFNNNDYKLILAIPFYGKIYQLEESLRNDESPIGKKFMDHHAQTASVVYSYRQICQKLNTEQWRRGYDKQTETAYIVKDTSTIIFDDVQAVAAKTSLAITENIGGVMAYSIDQDDYDASCSSGGRRGTSDYAYNVQDKSSQAYPLLQSIYDTIKRGPNSAAIHSSPLALIIAVLGSMLLKVYG